MNTISFDCDVTEFDITPHKENTENVFCLNDKAMVINFMSYTATKEKILMQSEISKESAIELAQLILFKYNKNKQ